MTTSPSPPSRKGFFPCYSPRRRTLVGDPVNCGEAICWIVIPASSSNTGCKLSAVNTFNPRCSGLVHEARIRIIKMVHSELHIDHLQRIKFERFKFDNFALVFCPGGSVFEFVPSSLNWKTYEGTKSATESDYFHMYIQFIIRVCLFTSALFCLSRLLVFTVTPSKIKIVTIQ